MSVGETLPTVWDKCPHPLRRFPEQHPVGKFTFSSLFCRVQMKTSLWSLAAPHNGLPEAGMVETTSLWLWRGDERAATARSLLIPFFPQGFPQIQLGEKMGAPLRLSLSSAAADKASFRTSYPHFSVWIFLLQLPANSLPGTALVCCLLPRNSPNLSGFVLQTGDKKMSWL